jgi:gliding motility-associated-like protein
MKHFLFVCIFCLNASFLFNQVTCDSIGNLIIYSNYDGGILTINIDQNIPNLKVGICTYEPVQVSFTGAFVGNITQVVYAGFNSTQNNNNCGQGNFVTSISGVPTGIVSILTNPQVGYTPVHGNGSGPWGGGMIGVSGQCDTLTNAGGGNTPDEVVYYFQQATGGQLLFHKTQYACWLNETVSISARGNCCIAPPGPSIGCNLNASVAVQPNSVCQPCNYNGPSILINEINIFPINGDGSIFGQSPTGAGMGEWIELFNPNWCDSVDISGYILGSYNSTFSTNPSTSNGMAFVLPPGTIVPPLGFVMVRGQNATPPPAGTIDVVVNNGSNQACIQGGINTSRIWFQNSGAWFAFYDSQGVPQDAIRWSNVTANDLNQTPCIPPTNNLPVGTTTLATFNEIATLGLAATLGASAQGMTYQRLPDGGAWSTTLANEATSYGSCNDLANCAVFSGVAQCNGTGTVNVNSGQAPFSYQWDDPLLQNTQTATNLCEGSYEVVVTDANNCQETYTVNVITNPFNLSTTIQNPGCQQSNGSITIDPFDPNYSYTWLPNVSTSNSANNLPQGTYTISISQGFCSLDTVIVLQNPVPFSVSAQSVQTTCGENNGSIAFDLTPAGNYVYSWLPNVSTAETATNLAAGPYQISITDNICVFDTTIIILPSVGLTSTSTVYNSTCQLSNGAIALDVFPTGNYTFSWPAGVNATSDSASNLSAGAYLISFTDGICTNDTVITVSTTNAPTDIIANITATQCDENTGEIAIVSTIGGAAPYTYALGNGAYSPNIVFDSLAQGPFIISVLDNNNCSYQETISVPIFAGPTLIQASQINPNCGLSNGSLVVNGTIGGTAPYSYSLGGAPIISGDTLSNLSIGQYSISVVDANGCTFLQNENLVMTAGISSIFIPNVLTANDDQTNDIWKINAICVESIECVILNRWGNKIYEFADLNGGWDGRTTGGEEAVSGVYFYRLTANYFGGDSEVFHGHITLIR